MLMSFFLNSLSICDENYGWKFWDVLCTPSWDLKQDIDIFMIDIFLSCAVLWEGRNSLNENFTDFKLRIYQVCEA